MKPTLPDVLNTAISGALSRARVMLPGRIESYNETTRRAEVQPLIKDISENEEGQQVATSLPVLSDVPVVFPGSGGTRVKYPVSAGDEVMLVFASSSIARWKFKGGLIDPGDTRRHALPDVIAITGLQSNDKENDLFLEFTAAAMLLGNGSATDAVVKGTTYRDAEDNLFSKLFDLIDKILGSSGVAPDFLPTPPANADNVAALAAFETAKAAFSLAAPTFLSTSVKVI